MGSICTLESGIMLKHVAAISIKIPLCIKNDFVYNIMIYEKTSQIIWMRKNILRSSDSGTTEYQGCVNELSDIPLLS